MTVKSNLCICVSFHYPFPVQHMGLECNESLEIAGEYGTRIKTVSVLRVYYTYGYGRTTLTATGVLGLRLRAYYAHGYRRLAATTTGMLQAYYGCAAGCKLTSGHYSCNREN